MTTESDPNVAVHPNVMTVPARQHDEIQYLPGDFAVQVYGTWWPSPSSIRTNLTDLQLIEYEQHLICHLCKRPCAGTCEAARTRGT